VARKERRFANQSTAEQLENDVDRKRGHRGRENQKKHPEREADALP